MHGTDQRTLAAADHAQPQPAPPCSPVEAERAAVGGLVAGAAGEILEALLGHLDDVGRDQLGPLARAVLRILQAAFPFEHGPAAVAVLVSLLKMPPKSTCPSPSERKRPARSAQSSKPENTPCRPSGLSSASLTWKALIRSW